MPEHTFRGTPDHVGLGYEDIYPITVDEVTLHGWHIFGESDVVWLIFHGNGGNISVRLDQYVELHRRYEASIVAIDYRGYGRSHGTPSEHGLYADAFATYEFTRKLYPGRKIVVFGRSMGAAVAAQLASVISPEALVLEAPVSSIPEVMREHAPWTRFTPLRLMIRAKFDTARYVSIIPTPVLLFHGDSDSTVSFRNS
ncbi:MAG: alpha/beta hydrolase [Chloroflexi bacterium]|nr:alpha/beta hydrolase [Chloroflexota bacterium]